MDLTGRVVLLTGVKRVGGVVAESLARAGADIALVHNRSSAESATTVDAVRALGRRAVAIQANLANPLECQRVVHDTLRELGRLDVLIAMASVYASVPLAAISAEQWDRQLEIDLRSAFLCA